MNTLYSVASLWNFTQGFMEKTSRSLPLGRVASPLDIFKHPFNQMSDPAVVANEAAAWGTPRLARYVPLGTCFDAENRRGVAGANRGANANKFVDPKIRPYTTATRGAIYPTLEFSLAASSSASSLSLSSSDPDPDAIDFADIIYEAPLSTDLTIAALGLDEDDEEDFLSVSSSPPRQVSPQVSRCASPSPLSSPWAAYVPPASMTSTTPPLTSVETASSAGPQTVSTGMVVVDELEEKEERPFCKLDKVAEWALGLREAQPLDMVDGVGEGSPKLFGKKIPKVCMEEEEEEHFAGAGGFPGCYLTMH